MYARVCIIFLTTNNMNRFVKRVCKRELTCAVHLITMYFMVLPPSGEWNWICNSRKGTEKHTVHCKQHDLANLEYRIDIEKNIISYIKYSLSVEFTFCTEFASITGAANVKNRLLTTNKTTTVRSMADDDVILIHPRDTSQTIFPTTTSLVSRNVIRIADRQKLPAVTASGESIYSAKVSRQTKDCHLLAALFFCLETITTVVRPSLFVTRYNLSLQFPDV